MSERRSWPDLGANAESVLAAFPFPERDWERDARAVEVRLSEAAPDSTEALLLAPPLPGEPGEPTAASATTTPLAHSGVRTQSLAELARRSVEKKQASEREMARESLAIAAQQKPSQEEARVLREVLSQQAAPPRPKAVAATAPTAAAGPRAARARPSPWPKLALGIPVLAFAAVALLWLKQSEPAPLVTNALPASLTVAKPLAAPNLAPSVAQSTDRGIDPSSLPGESPSKALDPAHPKAALAGPIAVAASAASAAPKPSAEKIELEEDQPAVVAAAAPEKAVEKALPPDPALRPADSSGGELPVKPSTGAVQAALGAVMSGARRCVAGDDAPSSALVVFGSDGRVQHVSVTGPAAGKSSGACIEEQLGHARVQPFAAPNFSVSATVRPD